MTDLRQSLLKKEFSYLKALAEKWGLPFTAPDARGGIDQFVDLLLTSGKLLQTKELLDDGEQAALIWLDNQDGKTAWDHFTRQFGELREMGVGRLDRERPDLQPISTVENLWYRALIARGFFDTDTGPQEFVYIPEDLRGIIMPILNPERNPDHSRDFICRKAASRERKILQPSSAAVLDHLCTLLAGLRIDLDTRIQMPDCLDTEVAFYTRLAKTIHVVDDQSEPLPDQIRDYFELSRPEALLLCWDSWRSSAAHHDLLLLPGIQLEANPELDSVRIRKLILNFLHLLNPQEWWSIESFVTQVKEREPDFLRIGGEYESMFIKNTASGEFLTGFSSWEAVEGTLIRYLLTGPLFWLGLVDLAAAAAGETPLAFRLSTYFTAMIENSPPALALRHPERVQVRAKGEIRMTLNIPHKIRYQVARFCEWGPVKAEAYLYTITPASLTRAEKQGLRVAHLLSLLKNHAEAIPPNILAALERWEKSGIQASIAPKTILRLGSPAVLKALKKSKASRFIQEQLGPTVVIIQEGSQEKIAEALVELGFFVELEDQTGSQV